MQGTKDAAQTIGLSRATVTRWATRLWVGAKVGTCWGFSAEDLDLIAENARKTRGNPTGWQQANAKKREKTVGRKKISRPKTP